MNTLFDIAGVSARIFHLPNREPFMIANDLAEIYGTRVDLITLAVKRNLERFPDDFTFELTPAEIEVLKTQNAFSKATKRPSSRVFTHIGAYALSGVLKTPIAAEMSVTIHRAFAAMEERSKAITEDLVQRLMYEASGPKSLRMKVIQANQFGWNFVKAKKMAKGHSVEEYRGAIHECVRGGLISKPLEGTPNPQPVKPSSADGQLSMFGGAA